MQPNDYEALSGRLVALEMILRGLFTKWALEADDPRGSSKRMLESMSASMREVDPPSDEYERRVCMAAEEFIQRFQRNIDARLIGLGHDR